MDFELGMIPLINQFVIKEGKNGGKADAPACLALARYRVFSLRA